ncbi:hypothetical protein PRZ48_010990 [Zasmidium cellare]|uniref:Serine hydrolase domain-containing protein n=1 Tax=Zasmidium cellare TaxID=395010 RepID=A0ABR0EA69_ZASCE|nr:hypothetical protein PRZ48_010990 [Zasmidium cellare]
MKILCLHGAYGSAVVLLSSLFRLWYTPADFQQNFQVQLAPFVTKIENSRDIEFKWIDGGHLATPPPEYETYFGGAPLYRHIEFDGVSKLDDILSKIRNFSKGYSSDDAIRKLVGEQAVMGERAVLTTIARLLKLLDDDPEIECGIFFCGWPPVRVESNKIKILLADECADVIDVPTCHIVGCDDPYIDGSMALYSLCDEETATLFDHGQGHLVPRDPRTIEELGAAIRETVNRSN